MYVIALEEQSIVDNVSYQTTTWILSSTELGSLQILNNNLHRRIDSAYTWQKLNSIRMRNRYLHHIVRSNGMLHSCRDHGIAPQCPWTWQTLAWRQHVSAFAANNFWLPRRVWPRTLWCSSPNSSSNVPWARCSWNSDFCSIHSVRCPTDIVWPSMVQHSMRYCCTIRPLAPNAHSRHSPTPNRLVAEWNDRRVCWLCTNRPAPATTNHASNWYCSSRTASVCHPNTHPAQRTTHNHQDQYWCWWNRSYCSPGDRVFESRAPSCTAEPCSCREWRGQRATTYCRPTQRVRMMAIFAVLATAVATFARRRDQRSCRICISNGRENGIALVTGHEHFQRKINAR